jgi:DNA repair protein RadC
LRGGLELRSLGVLLAIFLAACPAWAQGIGDAEGAAATAWDEIGQLDYEVGIVYFVDGEGRLLKTARVSQGMARGLYYVPWELVWTKLLPPDVERVFLVHNHPGGNWRLSQEDIELGRFWAEWAQRRGITFDLIAVAPSGRYTSLREEGLILPGEVELSPFDLYLYLLEPSLAMIVEGLSSVLGARLDVDSTLFPI